MKLSPAQVLIPWAAGLAAFSYIVSRWRAVRRGYHRLMDFTAGAVACFGIFSVAGRIGGGGSSAAVGYVAVGAAVGLAITSLGSSAISFARGARGPVFCLRLEAGAAVLGGVACLAIGAVLERPLLGAARALVSAAFLGSATATMVLGHWFLVDPDIPREAISRLAKLFVAATVLEIAVLLVPPGIVAAFSSERLGIGGYLPAFWIALAVATLVMGVLVVAAVREEGYPAIMAATGLSYLTILSAFGVDVIGKALISA